MATTRNSVGASPRHVYLMTIHMHGCPCPRNHMIVLASEERVWLEQTYFALKDRITNPALTLSAEISAISVPDDLTQPGPDLDAMAHLMGVIFGAGDDVPF